MVNKCIKVQQKVLISLIMKCILNHNEIPLQNYQKTKKMQNVKYIRDMERCRESANSYYHFGKLLGSVHQNRTYAYPMTQQFYSQAQSNRNMYICSRTDMYNIIHNSTILSSENLEILQKSISNKMAKNLYIHIVEYYTAMRMNITTLNTTT